jgi:glucose-6-phosphate 1-dehydrogenase
VQVTFKEDIGTDGRGGYFDSFGIVRDVCQNHLLQILALVAAEAPVSLASDDIRDEKVKAVRSIRRINLDDCVLGQYVSNTFPTVIFCNTLVRYGKSADGKQPAYLDDSTVPAGSVTPTYACMKFFIDNPRWDGVPFIMKAGKALDNKKTEIRIQFKPAPGNLYPDAAPNELVLRIQPNEAMYMKTNAKLPGMGHQIDQVELDMTYGSRFKDVRLPLAYERLILDVMRGDHSLFVRDDELKHAWALFDPLLDAIDKKTIPVHIYPRGSRGPPEGDALVSSCGFVRNEKYHWK